jgi:hypothetical protein
LALCRGDLPTRRFAGIVTEEEEIVQNPLTEIMPRPLDSAEGSLVTAAMCDIAVAAI